MRHVQKLAFLMVKDRGSSDAPESRLQELGRYLPIAGEVLHAVLDNVRLFVCIRLPFDEAKKLHIVECHC